MGKKTPRVRLDAPQSSTHYNDTAINVFLMLEASDLRFNAGLALQAPGWRGAIPASNRCSLPCSPVTHRSAAGQAWHRGQVHHTDASRQEAAAPPGRVQVLHSSTCCVSRPLHSGCAYHAIVSQHAEFSLECHDLHTQVAAMPIPMWCRGAQGAHAWAASQLLYHHGCFKRRSHIPDSFACHIHWHNLCCLL